jgi:hypothetical protein
MLNEIDKDDKKTKGSWEWKNKSSKGMILSNTMKAKSLKTLELQLRIEVQEEE